MRYADMNSFARDVSAQTRANLSLFATTTSVLQQWCFSMCIHPRYTPDVLARILCDQMQEQTKQAAARGDAAVTPLAELEFVPYLTEEGMVAKVDTTGVKASVYAVYDEVSESRHVESRTAEWLDCRVAIIVWCHRRV